jgi:hypothetical protein
MMARRRHASAIFSPNEYISTLNAHYLSRPSALAERREASRLRRLLALAMRGKVVRLSLTE